MALKEDLIIAGLAGLGLAILHSSANRHKDKRSSFRLGLSGALAALKVQQTNTVDLKGLSGAVGVTLDDMPTVDLPKNTKIIDV